LADGAGARIDDWLTVSPELNQAPATAPGLLFM